MNYGYYAVFCAGTLTVVAFVLAVYLEIRAYFIRRKRRKWWEETENDEELIERLMAELKELGFNLRMVGQGKVDELWEKTKEEK